MMELLKGFFSVRMGTFLGSVTICIILITFSPAFPQSGGGVVLEKDIIVESWDRSDYEGYFPDEVEFSIYDSETANMPIARQIFPEGKFTVNLKPLNSDNFTSGILVRFRVYFTEKVNFNDIPGMSNPAKGLWVDISVDGVPAGTRTLVPDSTLVRLLLANHAPVSTYRAMIQEGPENSAAASSTSLRASKENDSDLNNPSYRYNTGMASTATTTTTSTTTTSTTTTSVTTTSTTSTTLPAVVAYVKDDGICGGYSPCYSTIQSALNSLNANATLKVESGDYYEDLFFTNPINLVLECGFQDTFTSQTSNTAAYSLTISNEGMMTIDRLILYTEGPVTTTTTSTTSTTTSTTSTTTSASTTSTTSPTSTTIPVPPAQGS